MGTTTHSSPPSAFVMDSCSRHARYLHSPWVTFEVTVVNFEQSVLPGLLITGECSQFLATNLNPII